MPGFELINKEEKKAVIKIFSEGGTFFAHGFQKFRKKYHVREFEIACAKKFKTKYALCVTSGTAAIKIALKALKVKPGDEVITQSFNFIATIEAILDIGAKPVIVNVDSTLNMDFLELEKKITKRTKAIIPVHMLGVPANMKKINKIAKEKKIKILEDNCESVGGKYNGKYLGSIGDVGVLSFDHGKTITTGEGGMLLTNKFLIYKYTKEYHDHGHENNPKYPRGNDTKKIYGFNYRMTELQGAIGKVQLKKLNLIIKSNKKKYLILNKSIKKSFKIRKIPKSSELIYDCFIFFVKDKKIRNKIIRKLITLGIGTKNLPDAIKWHCSYFWSHALSKNEVRNSKKTFKLISSAVAIPIWLKVSIKKYKEIAKFIESQK